ncbi:MAG: hypothetical protein ABIW79_10365 [Gemmatimonas sp.]
MAIWDKVKQGIDKAGKAAQDVIDEGKLRIDAYRAREQADKAAEALGYAVFRAMDSGHELETAARERLVSALREREHEAKRLETELAAVKAADDDATGAATGATGASSSTSDSADGGSFDAGATTSTGTSAPPPTTPADTSSGEAGA